MAVGPGLNWESNPTSGTNFAPPVDFHRIPPDNSAQTSTLRLRIELYVQNRRSVEIESILQCETNELFQNTHFRVITGNKHAIRQSVKVDPNEAMI